MSEQNTEFDVWWEKEKLRSWLSMNSQFNQSHTEDNLPKEWSAAYKSHSKVAYDAATAEANKRIDALKRELNDTRDAYHASRTEFYKLQAHINNLRGYIKPMAIYETSIGLVIPKNRAAELLEATPAESLQAHDDELIEKCASFIENRTYPSGLNYAGTIRALKG